MSRYLTRPSARSVDSDGWAISTNPYGSISPQEDERPFTVSVSDHWDTNTGILDVNGEEIWRTANPMGFGRDDEW